MSIPTVGIAKSSQMRRFRTVINKDGEVIEDTIIEPGENPLSAAQTKRRERLGL